MLRAIEAEPWSPAMPRALWIVVLCAGTVMGISVGLRQTLGLFLAPVSLDLGIGRETFALGMGLMNLVWGLAAPFAGAVADRWGSGRVAVLGGLAYAGGLAVMTLDGGGGHGGEAPLPLQRGVPPASCGQCAHSTGLDAPTGSTRDPGQV